MFRHWTAGMKKILEKEHHYLRKKLHHRQIGPFRLSAEIKAKRRFGHYDIVLFLEADPKRKHSTPVLWGLFSFGRRDHGVLPWLDMHFREQTPFIPDDPFDLSLEAGVIDGLFRVIGELVKDGGMIFVSYITDITWDFFSPLHELTRKVLNVREPEIPPAVTPIGRLLFISGCRNIKGNIYDVQGSSRLAAEKSGNPAVEKLFVEKLRESLKCYLARSACSHFACAEKICRRNAEEILERLGPVPTR